MSGLDIHLTPIASLFHINICNKIWTHNNIRIETLEIRRKTRHNSQQQQNSESGGASKALDKSSGHALLNSCIAPTIEFYFVAEISRKHFQFHLGPSTRNANRWRKWSDKLSRQKFPFIAHANWDEKRISKVSMGDKFDFVVLKESITELVFEIDWTVKTVIAFLMFEIHLRSLQHLFFSCRFFAVVSSRIKHRLLFISFHFLFSHQPPNPPLFILQG